MNKNYTKKHFLSKISIVFLSIFIFFLSACNDENTGTKIGQNAPLIKAKNTHGQNKKIEKSGIEVVLFWESGCAGCISAMPYLEDFANTHKMNIYAINSINKTRAIKDFEKENNFKNILILEDILDISWKNYNINLVPSMFVLKDGKIVQKILGDRTWKFIEPKLLEQF